MGTKVPRGVNKPGEKATIGCGLGADFEPVGKRIQVTKARDAKPLKIRPRQTKNDRDR